MLKENGRNSRLCYLEASRVKGPVGDLAGVKLQTSAEEEIGTLDGVLIDPRARRVRFLVAEKPGWFRSRKYLVPTDCPAQVTPGHTLRIDVGADDLPTFDSVQVAEFTDEDLVDALFADTEAA
jgi:hypothetical protein